MLIAFDLDGTLIDSREDLAAAVNLTRQSFHLPPLSLETVVSFVGNGVKKLIARSFEGTDAPLEEALRRMGKFYSEHLLDRTVLYPGVAEGLAELAGRGHKLMLFTNKNTAPSRTILDFFRLTDYFMTIVGGDGGYPLKPAPDALLAARRLSGAKRTVMLGDNDTDLAAGREAGATRVFAQWGFGKARDEAYDFAVGNFEEFIKLVAELPEH